MEKKDFIYSHEAIVTQNFVPSSTLLNENERSEVNECGSLSKKEENDEKQKSIKRKVIRDGSGIELLSSASRMSNRKGIYQLYENEPIFLEEDVEYKEYVERKNEINFIFESIKTECKDLILPLFDKLDPSDLYKLIYEENDLE